MARVELNREVAVERWKWAIGVALLVAASGAAAQASPDSCDAARTARARQDVFAGPSGLRERVYVSDLLVLARCEPAGAPTGAERALGLLDAAGYKLAACSGSAAAGSSQLACKSHVSDAVELVPLSKAIACEGPGGACDVEFYVRASDRVAAPFGKSGGIPFGRFLGHMGAAGHHEITTAALTALGASPTSVEFMAKASRDPDLYDWNESAAHAQLEAFGDGCYRAEPPALDPRCGSLKEDSRAGRKRLQQWLQAKLDATRAACTEKQDAAAGYLTAYALHAVQDLVFHEGMSNAEHAYIDDNCGSGPNARCVDAGHRLADKLAVATQVSTRFLRAWSARLPACAGMMQLRPTDIAGFEPALALRRTLPGYAAFVRDYSKYQDQARQVRVLHECGVNGCPTTPYTFRLNPKWLGWTLNRPTAEIAGKAMSIADDLSGALQ